MTQKFGLTKPQQRCLDAIVGYQAEHGQTPSFSELLHLLGLSSKGNIARLLNGLEERGYIRRMPARSRSIALVNEASPIGDVRDVLNTSVRASLDAYCRINGEEPAAIINDAVAHYLDQEAGAFAKDDGAIIASLVEVAVPEAQP